MSTHLITHITLTESYTQTEHQSTPVLGVKRVHTKTRYRNLPQSMQPLATYVQIGSRHQNTQLKIAKVI